MFTPPQHLSISPQFQILRNNPGASVCVCGVCVCVFVCVFVCVRASVCLCVWAYLWTVQHYVSFSLVIYNSHRR